MAFADRPMWHVETLALWMCTSGTTVCVMLAILRHRLSAVIGVCADCSLYIGVGSSDAPIPGRGQTYGSRPVSESYVWESEQISGPVTSR
jgi:hypothetical protein